MLITSIRLNTTADTATAAAAAGAAGAAGAAAVEVNDGDDHPPVAGIHP